MYLRITTGNANRWYTYAVTQPRTAVQSSRTCTSLVIAALPLRLSASRIKITGETHTEGGPGKVIVIKIKIINGNSAELVPLFENSGLDNYLFV